MTMRELMIAAPSEKTAIAYKSQEISYRELHEKIICFSRAYSLKPRDRVILFSENRPEWIYTFYSVWLNQGIPVPVDVFSNAEDVAHILKDCHPAVVFHSEKSAPVLETALYKSGQSPIRLCLDQIPTGTTSDSKVELDPDQTATAVIIYTSGTAGSPKGVMLSYNNLHVVQQGYIRQSFFMASDKIIALLPFHHILPLQGNILLPLRIGASAILMDRLDSEAILQAFQSYHITLLIGVPRLYRLLLDGLKAKIRKNIITTLLFYFSRGIGSVSLGKIIFKKVQTAFGGNVRFFVSGGSVLDPEIQKGFKALGFRLLNGYGLTETSPSISNNYPDDMKIGSVGRVFPGVEIQIIHDEIVVRGPNVMQGYYNNRSATDSVLKNGWFHTGDRGYLDKKGYLYVTGRIKDIIVLPNGKKVNPEEMEQKILASYPILKEIGIYQDGDSLGAILVTDLQQVMKSQIVNLQETLRWSVIDAYNHDVPSYRKIRSMTIHRGELPKTKLGKIKRFLLPQLARQTSPADPFTEEPDLEEYRLVREFLEDTGKANIHPHHHLELDIGLDSLDKVELLVFIERAFGVSLQEAMLVQFPHLLALCEHLQSTKTQVHSQTVNWNEILREPIHTSLPPRSTLLQFIRLLFKPLSILYFRFEVKGKENVPAHIPCIIASNHQSYLDVLFVTCSLKCSILRKTYFFAKEKHFHSSFRRAVAQNSNVIVMNVNSGLKAAIQQTAAVLKNGKNMVIFPEGARSRDGQLMPFKKTFAILSKELDVPIIPTVIQGAYESLSVGGLFPKPIKIILEFLKPVYPGGNDYETLIQHTRNHIQTKLHNSIS